jgi:hypothetical protein
LQPGTIAIIAMKAANQYAVITCRHIVTASTSGQL